MLSNAYFLAKFRFDTAENEPVKNLQKKIQNFAKFANFADPNPLTPLSRRTGGGATRWTPRAAASRRTSRRAAPRGPPPSSELAKFRQNVARFRLYRHRFLQENTRFAASFKIYQILKLKYLKSGNILQICDICKIFAEFSQKLLIFQTDVLLKLLRLQRCKSMQIL